MKSRAESEECEDQRTTKKVETSHSAKDASTGMRQAESRPESSLHQKSESELSRIRDGWHCGRILARFQTM